MPTERVTAALLVQARELAKARGCGDAAALDHLQGRKLLDAPTQPTVVHSVAVPATAATDAALALLCNELPEATEAGVEHEIACLLTDRYDAHELADYGPAEEPAKGRLIKFWTTHKRKPLGITAGAPDLWLARVGLWGWVGIELKARTTKGRMAGRLSREQAVAVRAGLYTVAWAPAHVALRIAALDKQAGYAPAKGQP